MFDPGRLNVDDIPTSLDDPFGGLDSSRLQAWEGNKANLQTEQKIQDNILHNRIFVELEKGDEKGKEKRLRQYFESVANPQITLTAKSTNQLVKFKSKLDELFDEEEVSTRLQDNNNLVVTLHKRVPGSSKRSQTPSRKRSRAKDTEVPKGARDRARSRPRQGDAKTTTTTDTKETDLDNANKTPPLLIEKEVEVEVEITKPPLTSLGSLQPIELKTPIKVAAPTPVFEELVMDVKLLETIEQSLNEVVNNTTTTTLLKTFDDRAKAQEDIAKVKGVTWEALKLEIRDLLIQKNKGRTASAFEKEAKALEVNYEAAKLQVDLLRTKVTNIGNELHKAVGKMRDYSNDIDRQRSELDKYRSLDKRFKESEEQLLGKSRELETKKQELTEMENKYNESFTKEKQLENKFTELMNSKATAEAAERLARDQLAILQDQLTARDSTTSAAVTVANQQIEQLNLDLLNLETKAKETEKKRKTEIEELESDLKEQKRQVEVLTKKNEEEQQLVLRSSAEVNRYKQQLLKLEETKATYDRSLLGHTEMLKTLNKELETAKGETLKITKQLEEQQNDSKIKEALELTLRTTLEDTLKEERKSHSQLIEQLKERNIVEVQLLADKKGWEQKLAEEVLTLRKLQDNVASERNELVKAEQGFWRQKQDFENERQVWREEKAKSTPWQAPMIVAPDVIINAGGDELQRQLEIKTKELAEAQKKIQDNAADVMAANAVYEVLTPEERGLFSKGFDLKLFKTKVLGGRLRGGEGSGPTARQAAGSVEALWSAVVEEEEQKMIPSNLRVGSVLVEISSSSGGTPPNWQLESLKRFISEIRTKYQQSIEEQKGKASDQYNLTLKVQQLQEQNEGLNKQLAEAQEAVRNYQPPPVHNNLAPPPSTTTPIFNFGSLGSVPTGQPRQASPFTRTTVRPRRKSLEPRAPITAAAAGRPPLPNPNEFRTHYDTVVRLQMALKNRPEEVKEGGDKSGQVMVESMILHYLGNNNQIVLGFLAAAMDRLWSVPVLQCFQQNDTLFKYILPHLRAGHSFGVATILGYHDVKDWSLQNLLLSHIKTVASIYGNFIANLQGYTSTMGPAITTQIQVHPLSKEFAEDLMLKVKDFKDEMTEGALRRVNLLPRTSNGFDLRILKHMDCAFEPSHSIYDNLVSLWLYNRPQFSNCLSGLPGNPGFIAFLLGK